MTSSRSLATRESRLTATLPIQRRGTTGWPVFAGSSRGSPLGLIPNPASNRVGVLRLADSIPARFIEVAG
jgi:hypothetical protein